MLRHVHVHTALELTCVMEPRVRDSIVLCIVQTVLCLLYLPKQTALSWRPDTATEKGHTCMHARTSCATSFSEVTALFSLKTLLASVNMYSFS